MPLDFLSNACKTTSNKDSFGLCDDPPPSTNPAYIDETDPSIWIATVENDNNKEIHFYAVDNCVNVLRPDGLQESRCDGILRYENNLIFIELKNRGSKGWLGEGTDLLIITFRSFSINHKITDFIIEHGYVCNKQRPLVITNNSNIQQKLKDETGLLLKAQSKISIE